jgi:hypothetical protein
VWLHSFVIGIGGLAVCVGTDDDGLAAALSPWVIDAPATLVDFGAQLHPPPAARGSARVHPNLRHGSDWIASAPDPAVVREGFLRILGALAGEPAPGEFRLAAVPSVRDGAVDLLTVPEVSHGSYRRLSRGGSKLLLVDRVDVDPAALTVRIAAPLGSSDPPLVWPLRSWHTVPLGPSPDAPLTLVVASAAPRLVADAATGAAALDGLLRLVQQLRPERVG